MRKLKLLLMAFALLGGASSANAGTDVTASYIGDVTQIVVDGHNCTNQHKESDGKGWWNSQTIPESWHAFAAPNASGGTGESWSGKAGGEGMMMGRTMVLPAGNYTLSFDAFGCTSTNGQYPNTPSSAGDVVAYLTGETPIDITNTTQGGNTFHNVQFTFDVAADNTDFEFGIKKAVGNSTADWCQIKNVSLVLNSTNIFPVANNNTDGFTYSLADAESKDTWHTNTWSDEGQSDGSRFQVPFHELWKQSGGLLDADITASHTPTETGVYKVSAWVRVVNESGGAVNGVNIFVGDTEANACSGSSVISGKGRLGTYTAMADGTAGTPFNFGFKIKDSDANWLAFKNVTITYLGDLPQAEIDALLAQVPSGKMSATIKTTLDSKVKDLNNKKSVAAYNALASYIATANASINDYADLSAAIADASSYTPLTNADAYSAAIATAQGVYDDASEENCSSIINDLKAAKQNANVADYTYVEDNFPYAVDLGTWEATNATERNGQHYDDTDASQYYEQNAGYFDESWSCSYSQDLALPAGNYVFKVAGRKSSDNSTLTLRVTSGNEVLGTVNDFPKGASGKGITTAGVASFDAGEFANNGAGRGWQWRYVKFTLAAPGTVNVSVTGSANAKSQWVSFCNATVQTDDEDNVALMTALVALNSAKTAATLTERTNKGTGVFQYNKTTDDELWSAYSTAKTNAEAFELTAESEATAVNGLATALTTATTNYSNNAVLNPPATDKRYNLTFHCDGHVADGNAITFIAGGRDGEGNYGLQYLAPSNANLNQAVKFTAVDGETNTYKLSGINVANGGECYLTTRSVYDDEDADKNIKLRTTDDVDKALWVKIEATSTSGQFQMRNVTANAIIAHNGNNNEDMFTRNSANFTIAEAEQASVRVNIASDVKYGTRIFPFTPALPSGVKAYSCAAEENGVLTLVEVEEPAANTPYILELTAENAIDNNLEGWGTAASLDAKTDGLLTGVYEEQFATAGTYVLQNNNNKVAFYKVADGKEPIVGAYRCYLTEPSGNGSGEARDAFFFDEGEATAIDAISALTSGEAQIFNAAGAQLPSLQKGMNILQLSNGKSIKVMVK